ncbi:hypothetical protein OESDEN_21223 [Oesophagostomum dentatum]|uniref:Uncharacterized protein n=1 Tax=Oesophagostomum dentatum TaxID=61180 RepID=A0A0B1S2K7_OESDE|nr:hypothetical protein OESDEN_21223 [Oesophagostomum dentatum]
MTVVAQLVILLAIVLLLRLLFSLLKLYFMDEILSSISMLIVAAFLLWSFCYATESFPEAKMTRSLSYNGTSKKDRKGFKTRLSAMGQKKAL